MIPVIKSRFKPLATHLHGAFSFPHISSFSQLGLNLSHLRLENTLRFSDRRRLRDKWYNIRKTDLEGTILEETMDNIDHVARIERKIEKRMEAACEKNGWYVAVAMMPPERTTLHIEKFGEEPAAGEDAQAALDSAVAFAKAEFGTEATAERFDEKIPNTRAPYHVTFLVKVDASKRVAELAA